MPTQTFNEWPEIKHEGVHLPLESRPRKKKVRKYSIIYNLGVLIKTLILTAAFLVIIGAAGNAIELLARW